MKKIITCLVLLAFATTSFCQRTIQKPTLESTDYLQKSKKQKKTATILLAVGAGLIVTSVVIPKGELTYDGICIGAYCSDKYKNDGIKAAFGLSGVAAMLGSIPFFIASGENKRRAMSVSFKNQNVPQLQKSSFVYKTIPGLNFKISL